MSKVNQTKVTTTNNKTPAQKSSAAAPAAAPGSVVKQDSNLNGYVPKQISTDNNAPGQAVKDTSNSNMPVRPFLDQDFQALRDECLKNKTLFEDPKFPADDRAMYRITPQFAGTKWLRPHFVVKNPQFIVNSIAVNDLDQGQIGNCWFVSAAASILSRPDLAQKVVPTDQSFDPKTYAGIFHFRFWFYGEWVDVVVDDRLPVDQYNRLMFCRNKVDVNEMFGGLLEKAYAKLNICYEFLIGGQPYNAITDLSGGVHEYYSFKAPAGPVDSTKKNATSNYLEPALLWEVILESFNAGSLATTSTSKGNVREAVQNNKLVSHHAYSILEAYEIYARGGAVFDTLRKPTDKYDPNAKSLKLLRLRNPWGQDESFTGSFSTNSKDWDQVKDTAKNAIRAKEQTDGQFLMKYEDFLSAFDAIDFVHVNLNGFSRQLNGNSWSYRSFSGEWLPGNNAGGCGYPNYADFWKNPQYTFTIAPQKNPEVNVIVSLMQTEMMVKFAQKKDPNANKASEAIAFTVFKLKPDAKLVGNKYDQSGLERVFQSSYVYSRDVTNKLSLTPGVIVVIPATYDKDRNMKFFLRVFIEDGNAKSTSVVPANNNVTINTNQNNNPNPAVNPAKPANPTPNPNPNPNPNPAVTPVKPVNPTPTPNPNPAVTPNKPVNPTPNPTPAPNPNPKPEMKIREVVIDPNSPYDKWFYNGMSKADIDKLNINAQQATAKSCQLM